MPCTNLIKLATLSLFHLDQLLLSCVTPCHDIWPRHTSAHNEEDLLKADVDMGCVFFFFTDYHPSDDPLFLVTVVKFLSELGKGIEHAKSHCCVGQNQPCDGL